ncbi:MAG: ATP synthase F1 subunit gamma [bacterium]|nr:ATP synthase F1 subunit gamma [bacterium]
MPANTRLIKRRIKSVLNTRKITGAMELVAASKMRRSAESTHASRAYTKGAWEIVDEARKDVDENIHPLLGGRRVPKASLVLVIASDRGLCGGFNVQLAKTAITFLKGRNENLLIATIGKRASQAVKRAGYEITTAFESIANAPSFEQSVPIGSYAYNAFIKGDVDRVFVVYTDYKSALSQIPAVEQLLPIIPESDLKDLEFTEEKITDKMDEDEGLYGSKKKKQKTDDGFQSILFEPNPQQVFDALLPRLLETRIYQFLLESASSEHAARMMAMKNATKNAGDMIQSLQFTYNQARQAGITQEMLEITSGKAAIE